MLELYLNPATKTTVLRIANPVSFIAAAVVNGLGGAGLISGTGIGEVSDANPTLITPAGYAFTIWSVIYTLLALFCVWSALAGVKLCGGRELSCDNHCLLTEQIGFLFVGSNLFNAGWIATFVWDTTVTTWLSTALILGIELCLVGIYLRAGLWRTPRDSCLIFLCVDVTFSIYLGWVTVATILNVSLAMSASGVGNSGDLIWTETGWACAMMSTAAILALFMLSTRSDICYPLVYIWAILAIVQNSISAEEDRIAIQAAGGSLIGVVAAFTTVTLLQHIVHAVRTKGNSLPNVIFAESSDIRSRRDSINNISPAVFRDVPKDDTLQEPLVAPPAPETDTVS